MKNKVGRPKGTTTTHKTFRIDNELLEFWNKQKNKNRMINLAIQEYKTKQEN